MVDVAAFKLNPLLLVVAAIVAVGVPAATPVNANCAEVVEAPPTAKSNVELIGESKPLLSCR